MTTRNIRGAPAAMLTLSLLAVLLVPARAALAETQSGDDQTDEGWKKVLAFARCAFHVFRAVTPTDWTVAALDCGRLYMEEPPLPGGGRP